MNRMNAAVCVALLCVTSGCVQYPLSRPASKISSSDTPLASSVSTSAELETRIAAGPTPLDALTPYGKRQFIARLSWGSRGLGSFSYQPLVRELDAGQINAILSFLGAQAYSQSVTQNLAATPPLRLPDPSPELERSWNAFLNWSDKQDQQRRENIEKVISTDSDTSALTQQYRSGFGKRMHRTALEQAPAGDLLILFEAASHVAFRSNDTEALQDLKAVFQEMENRGIDTRRGFNATMIKILLASQQFETASDFLKRHPDATTRALPSVLDNLNASFQGRSVLELDGLKNTLTRLAIHPVSERQLIMVVGAGCHFSSDALQYISNNQALSSRLRSANLLIMTAPGASLSLDFVGDWNASHPSMSIRIPYSRAEWRDIDVPSVPMFYIFEHGRLRQTISGWPPEGHEQALLQALDAAAEHGTVHH